MRLEHILVVDDEDPVRRTVTDLLQAGGRQALGVSGVRQAQEALQADTFDLVVSDLRLADGDGLGLLREVRQRFPRTQVILMTGYATMDLVVECLRLGFADFLIKPFSAAELDFAIRRLEELEALQSENTYLRQEVERSGGLVPGRNPLMQAIVELARKVAATEATVLIEGETGTGKEVLAQLICQCSARAAKPFIKVNCAAVPEALLESEFFGHERGAFTGAVQRREGRFETAHEGTLLLDEIAEIPLTLQVKLLRVLQEREFTRVGGNKTVRVDVRILASTNRDLREEVRAGRFREDLFYRLNVVPIHLPPLRQRLEDLPELVEAFLNLFARRHGKRPAGLTDQAWEKLRQYRWPGNVRELQNVVERAVILGTGGRPIDAAELVLPDDPDLRAAAVVPLFLQGPLPTMADVERQLIGAALVRCDNNRTHAARRLGISLRTLRNKLAAYRAMGYDTANPQTLAA